MAADTLLLVSENKGSGGFSLCIPRSVVTVLLSRLGDTLPECLESFFLRGARPRRWTPMAAGIPVLTFHALDEGRDAVAFSPELFERCMIALDETGCRVVALNQLVSRLRSGDFPQEDLAAITFDDGYRSVYDVALPVLSRLRMPATVFVSPLVAERAGGERLPPQNGREKLSWAEMDEMGRCGFDFGGHTVNHCDLTQVDAVAAKREIHESKRFLEEALSRPVELFAYPFGRYDKASQEIVERVFDGAFSDRLGLLDPRDDLSCLPRVEMYYFRSARTFPLLLDRRLPWYLSLRRFPRWVRRLRRM